MKSAKTAQEKAKRSAEDWVGVAREFGEKCQAIQHDPKLDLDQKLEKQKALGQQMGKEIQADPNLKKEEKQLMIASINNYMDEWSKMHDLMKKVPEKSGQKPAKK